MRNGRRDYSSSLHPCALHNDPGRGGVRGPRAAPRYPGVGAFVRVALPGSARGAGSEDAGACPDVPGGRAVAAAALPRGMPRGSGGKKNVLFFRDLTGFLG